ncbi:mitochondrial glycine transporter B-like isoform X2 [Paramacrobiotus metropolitanus]|uniref:mitochondrial glycine transporter B-like isoform X2 n=1 Tax=Paramacrobiotus metropolitanus TaxID=2943436 RepID=UPI0024460738|nr:mitochondrial glycine transporter B-like isoform X2 [Paramacrobiotus metropolitanus]
MSSEASQLIRFPKWRTESLLSNTTLRSFVAGSFTGVCSTLLFQPLDLIKTRIQANLVSRTPEKALSIKVVPIVRQILREESVVGLWRGTVPSLLRTVPGVGIYFSSIHFLQQQAGPDCGSTCFIVIGILGRFIASLSVLPFTVIKARYESGLFRYGSVLGALRSTAAQEGIKSLYSGFVPTLLRDAPFSGIYLMFYELIKSSLRKQFPDYPYTPVMHFGSGLTAGLLASIVTHPFDVIKTHVQLSSQAEKRTLVYTASNIWRSRGLTGYFAGLVPRIARRTLMTATSWTVYEQVIRSVGLVEGARRA